MAVGDVAASPKCPAEMSQLLENRFDTLTSQVAEHLRLELSKGGWGEWMPSERNLTNSLQVSRKTLRKALGRLQNEGLVETIHGLGTRILVKAKNGSVSVSSKKPPVVVLLTPEPLERMRPYTSHWVNHLKSMLIEHGARLLPIDGRKYFSRRPGNALARLISQHTANCWVLGHSREDTQRWFAENGLPCVIAGSCHAGVDLPDLDVDHFAICRHAVGRLLAAGHRHVAMLNAKTGRAGDVESEAGFVAGMRGAQYGSIVPQVINHEHSVDHLCKALAHLLDQKHPPTALLVSDPTDYLTVVSVLAQSRLRVPQDISVICRDDDYYLNALVPTPTCYVCTPSSYARHLLKSILHVIEGETVTPRHVRIFPKYSKGETLRNIL